MYTPPLLLLNVPIRYTGQLCTCSAAGARRDNESTPHASAQGEPSQDARMVCWPDENSVDQSSSSTSNSNRPTFDTAEQELACGVLIFRTKLSSHLIEEIQHDIYHVHSPGGVTRTFEDSYSCSVRVQIVVSVRASIAEPSLR